MLICIHECFSWTKTYWCCACLLLNILYYLLNKWNFVDETIAWDRASTKLLIQSYSELKEQFRNPKLKKKDLWQEIEAKFRKQKYRVNTEALDRKWRNLKKRYTTIKDGARKTGRGRISWEYYADMDEIFHEDRTVNLPRTISSVNYRVPGG